MGKDTKTLFKHNTLSKDWNVDTVTDPIASKLDRMAEVLELVPVYSKSSTRVKHKLMTVLHQNIAAIHIICPSIMECNEPHCNHWALRQDTRTQDIPQVTLIKGTTIHRKVYVLSGLCTHCNSKYYADRKGIDQISANKRVQYLNSAKYMKIGQSTWVDSGMHSFHASAAAYTNYWDNAFGEVNLNHMAALSRKHIGQTFIQESTRVIAANQNHNLTLSESSPNGAVTHAAFSLLGQQGVISASQGHACSECTHPFRSSNDPNDMDVGQ